jgi:hypothetical protein
VAGITSEWWPASVRNGGRHQIGIPAGFKSEYLAGMRRNLHRFLSAIHRAQPKLGAGSRERPEIRDAHRNRHAYDRPSARRVVRRKPTRLAVRSGQLRLVSSLPSSMAVVAQFLGSTQPRPNRDMPFVVLWSDTAQGSYCGDARACSIVDAIFGPATKGLA